MYCLGQKYHRSHSLPNFRDTIPLRADSVFCYAYRPGNVDKQGWFLYFPEFISSSRSYLGSGSSLPQEFYPRSYHRHVKAEKVVKALLVSLEMPDVAYLELAAIGERFVCGCCYSHKPMDWEGIVSFSPIINSTSICVMANQI
jgi:hypothetical protein